MGKDIDTDQFLGQWVHSHEEDESGRMVFRPGEFSFPPSRGRFGFTLLSGGDLEVEAPGPDDRRTSATGRWSFDGRRLAIDAPNWARNFEVEQLDEDMLVVRHA